MMRMLNRTGWTRERCSTRSSHPPRRENKALARVDNTVALSAPQLRGFFFFGGGGSDGIAGK